MEMKHNVECHKICFSVRPICNSVTSISNWWLSHEHWCWEICDLYLEYGLCWQSVCKHVSSTHCM